MFPVDVAVEAKSTFVAQVAAGWETLTVGNELIVTLILSIVETHPF